MRQQRPRLAAEVAAARAAGDAERTPLLFGQDAGLIDTIEPAGDLISRIVREAHNVLAGRLAQLVGVPARP